MKAESILKVSNWVSENAAELRAHPPSRRVLRDRLQNQFGFKVSDECIVACFSAHGVPTNGTAWLKHQLEVCVGVIRRLTAPAPPDLRDEITALLEQHGISLEQESADA